MNNFKPGFRLSFSDIVALIMAFLAAGFFYDTHPILSAIIIFVILHFFLFCNIIRISRIPELIWSALFLLQVSCSILFDKPGLLLAFSISLACTVILIILELRKPSYHGVLWQKFNPSLLQWFETS
jgi:hypothetical protein